MRVCTMYPMGQEWMLAWWMQQFSPFASFQLLGHSWCSQNLLASAGSVMDLMSTPVSHLSYQCFYFPSWTQRWIKRHRPVYEYIIVYSPLIKLISDRHWVNDSKLFTAQNLLWRTQNPRHFQTCTHAHSLFIYSHRSLLLTSWNIAITIIIIAFKIHTRH